MAADEIFVLFLIVVSVGTVVALSVHSRRQETATDSFEKRSVSEAPERSEPVSTEGEPLKIGARAERR